MRLHATCRYAIYAFASATLLAACEDPFTAQTGTRAFQSLATGAEHTCAVSTSGDAFCWGRGDDGELGNGVKENRFAPTPVAGSLEFKEITAGQSHTCALATGGQAYCWGWNAYFQRGNSDASDAAPTAVASSVRFRAISAGANHTCALSVDSIAYCWGYNRFGQIGDGTLSSAATPTRVQTALKFRSISAGANHTCAITPTDDAYCWGSNEYGQLGIRLTQPNSAVPFQVQANEGFASIAAGRTHTCGVGKSTVFYCWGSNEYGELGDGSRFAQGVGAAYVPQRLSPFFQLGRSIFAGESHTCAIAPDSTGWCWGRGEFGQLGTGSTSDQFVPQAIFLQPETHHTTDKLHFSFIATGGTTHVCGLADGSVFCWGTGMHGQLGVPGVTFAPLPLRVSDQ